MIFNIKTGRFWKKYEDDFIRQKHLLEIVRHRQVYLLWNRFYRIQGQSRFISILSSTWHLKLNWVSHFCGKYTVHASPELNKCLEFILQINEQETLILDWKNLLSLIVQANICRNCIEDESAQAVSLLQNCRVRFTFLPNKFK